MGSSQHKQTVFLLLYVFCISFLLYLFSPYVTAILLGIVIVLGLHPVNMKMKNYVGEPTSSVLMTVFVTLIIVIPLVFALFAVVEETSTIQRVIQDTNMSAVEETVASFTGITIDVDTWVSRGVSQVQSYAASQLPGVLSSLTSAAVNTVILFFTIYYGFREGDVLVRKFFEVLPLGDEHKQRLRERSHSVFSGVLYGQLFVSIIQGLLGGLSFFIFGVSGPVFWGMIMAVLSFIPLLGSPIIWLPASLLLFVFGNTYAAIGVFVFNAVITSNIDNFLKPKVIGDRTQMHPLLVLLSIFGGLSLFGAIGFVIGPVLVSAAYLVIQFYLEDITLGNAELP